MNGWWDPFLTNFDPQAIFEGKNPKRVIASYRSIYLRSKSDLWMGGYVLLFQVILFICDQYWNFLPVFFAGLNAFLGLVHALNYLLGWIPGSRVKRAKQIALQDYLEHAQS